MLPKEEVDWSKASEDEIIEEAKKRYPIGATYYYPHKKDIRNRIIKGDFKTKDNLVCDGIYVLLRNGKWIAEIVSEPVKEDATQYVNCKCKNLNEVENCVRNCGHGLEPVIQDDEIKLDSDTWFINNLKGLAEMELLLMKQGKIDRVDRKKLFEFVSDNLVPTKRPSLVEAEKEVDKFIKYIGHETTNEYRNLLIEYTEKLILKNKE